MRIGYPTRGVSNKVNGLGGRKQVKDLGFGAVSIGSLLGLGHYCILIVFGLSELLVTGRLLLFAVLGVVLIFAILVIAKVRLVGVLTPALENAVGKIEGLFVGLSKLSHVELLASVGLVESGNADLQSSHAVPRQIVIGGPHKVVVGKKCRGPR